MNEIKLAVSEMKVNVKGWLIGLWVDEDGHLTIGINHNDKSKVLVSSVGFGALNEEEWVERFTTKKIEEDYENKK